MTAPALYEIVTSNWENTWRLVYAPPTEPGAIPITVMLHPAAYAAAAAIPSPDHGTLPATWAP
ncbi:hypothetical protein AB0K89_26410 [Streptomyces cinnamoneus]|uniref:hypothetical protein n=1 Tax=Streptomyces cinnamoneus TaxID=53446 RepID=UPI003423438F